jgi:hypothetical protein
MKLTPEQLGQISDALLRAFDYHALKRMVRMQLGENIADIVGAGTNEDVVFDLVVWAERYDLVAELVQGALKANSTNAELQKVARAFNEWSLAYFADKGKASAQLREQLTRLVVDSGVNSDDLDRLVKRCRPKTLEARIDPVTSPISATAFLWDITDSYDTSLPVVEFAERLARQVRAKRLSRELLQWIEEAIGSSALPRPVNREHVEHMRSRLNKEATQKSHLLVEVIPSTTKHPHSASRRYRLRLYLWTEEDGCEPWDLPTHRDGRGLAQTFTFAQIVQQIHWALSDHEANDPANDPDTIEFLLPFELIASDIDRLEFQISNRLRQKLWYKYSIIVRSYERLRGPSREFGLARKAWRSTWNLFRDWQEQLIAATHMPSDKESPVVTWLARPEDCSSEEMNERLLNDLTRERKKGVCLALTFPPLMPAVPVDSDNLLKTMLLAGAPIIIWSRKHIHFAISFEDIKTELASIVCIENLPKLPSIVFTLRKSDDAIAKPEHIGNHITLFWDDPDRVPASMNRDMKSLREGNSDQLANL